MTWKRNLKVCIRKWKSQNKRKGQKLQNTKEKAVVMIMEVDYYGGKEMKGKGKKYECFLQRKKTIRDCEKADI